MPNSNRSNPIFLTFGASSSNACLFPGDVHTQPFTPNCMTFSFEGIGVNSQLPTPKSIFSKRVPWELGVGGWELSVSIPWRPLYMHRAIPADALEVEEQPDVDDGHREGDERIRLERLAVANDAGFDDRLLLGRLRRGLLRCRQLGAVEAVDFFEEQELAGGRRLVLLVDGWRGRLQVLRGIE